MNNRCTLKIVEKSLILKREQNLVALITKPFMEYGAIDFYPNLSCSYIFGWICQTGISELKMRTYVFHIEGYSK